MSIRKEYNKSKNVCNVTFTLPKEAAKTAKKVHLVGEFNNWNNASTPLKKAKNGAFSVTVPLQVGKEYQFRYLIDNKSWENDWNADKYAPSPHGNENSVVVI